MDIILVIPEEVNPDSPRGRKYMKRFLARDELPLPFGYKQVVNINGRGVHNPDGTIASKFMGYGWHRGDTRPIVTIHN